MLTFDTEGNGLVDTMTELHCINIIDRTTGQSLRFNEGVYADGTIARRDGSLADGARLLQEAEAICGHNIIGHDLPAIQKVFPWFKPKGRVHDTLVYARLIWTNIRDIDLRAIKRKRRPPAWDKGCKSGDKAAACTGRHSLAAWGFRLGDYKGDFVGPWDAFTAEMDDYCDQDVAVTVKLMEKIEAEGYDDDSLQLESRVAEIIRMQETHGFLLDVEAARRLEGELIGLAAELADKLRSAFDPWFEPVYYKGRPVVETPKRSQRRKVVYDEGGPTTLIHYSTDAPYSKVKLVSFEPGSRDMIAGRLKTLFGWEPQSFTPAGKPQVDADALDGLVDIPEAAMLRDYLTITKRIGQLSSGQEAILNHVGPDGRVHGRVNSNGAVTGRMTHSKPNPNWPKVKHDEATGAILYGLPGGYGYEFRSLATVPKRKKMVGVDAEGLELRMLGHYLYRYDQGAYVKALLEGDKKLGTDVHSLNQKSLKSYSRDGAKRIQYAYLYGGGNRKLGWIYYDDQSPEWREAFHRKFPAGPEREAEFVRMGARLRTALETGVTGLGELQKKVREKVKQGFLLSLDGRKLHIRSAHSALNTLLQGGGAVVMKLALVMAHDGLVARGWEFGREFAFVLNVHDEFQIEADEDIAEEVGQIAADAIREAGERFAVKCPLAGSKDVGGTWADTH